MLALLHKKPADHLDYDVDFSRWLPDGDTVSTVETQVSPAVTVDEPDGVVVTSVHVESQIVKVWLSGGVAEKTYTITVTAATLGGRIKETEFQIRVKDC